MNCHVHSVSVDLVHIQAKSRKQSTSLRFGTKLSSQGRVFQVAHCDCFGSCQNLGLATRAIFCGLFGACAVYRSRLVNAFVDRLTRQ